MSNELVHEFTAAAMTFKSTQRLLMKLDDGFGHTLTEEPKIPDLFEGIVATLVNNGSSEEVINALDEATRRLLAGAGARAIATGNFDPATVTQICHARSVVLDLPKANTPDTVLNSDQSLRTILYHEAERFARMVREVRANNEAATERFNAEREEMALNLVNARTHLDLAASRLARRVLLKRGVDIFDVIKTERKAQSWEIFVNALIAEVRWIIVGRDVEEKSVALEAVRGMDTGEATLAALAAGVGIYRAYSECIQTLGYAS